MILLNHIKCRPKIYQKLVRGCDLPQHFKAKTKVHSLLILRSCRKVLPFQIASIKYLLQNYSHVNLLLNTITYSHTYIHRYKCSYIYRFLQMVGQQEPDMISRPSFGSLVPSGSNCREKDVEQTIAAWNGMKEATGVWEAQPFSWTDCTSSSHGVSYELKSFNEVHY